MHLTADGHGIVEEKESNSGTVSAHGIVAGVAGADIGTMEEGVRDEKVFVEHNEVRVV